MQTPEYISVHAESLERKALNEQIDEFFKAGGKVTELPTSFVPTKKIRIYSTDSVVTR